jgi:NTP pyrophosphatase (non-canonical NTP hydrolase)
MSSLNLEKLNSEIEKFVTERDWDQFHSVKNLAMALNVESSELLEIVQWMSEADSNQLKHDPDKKAKLQDEVADIFYYLLRIIQKTDINLEEAMFSKLKKNAEKYPVEKARGNSKKYNEL